MPDSPAEPTRDTAPNRVQAATGSAPLIVHIIHRLDTGGMENGLVNLINHMPRERFRHAIVCMTDYTDFSRRLQREDVALYGLGKREGKDLAVHLRLWRLLRRLRPAIVHTRNLATLETQVTAMLAGVRRRVHGEHGWDVGDPDGSNVKNRRLRRLVRPLVGEYIALSRHQVAYLRDAIAVPDPRLTHICNGVDTQRFHPPAGGREALPDRVTDATGIETAAIETTGIEAAGPDTVVIGAVMRMQPVKAPEVLLEAFLDLLDRVPEARRRLRLVMVGDGPLLPELRRRVAAAGAEALVWLPGTRPDVPELMRAMDLFVVPSRAEGICNTILEAMASGLPVVATDVGGNPDLVAPGITGALIPAGDPHALAAALEAGLRDPEGLRRQGRAAREAAVYRFSMETMVAGYTDVYDRLIGRPPE